MEKTINLLKTYLKKDESVIVACSAGPDSMCLLSLVEKLPVRVVCAHVNHGVRPESKEEYAFLEDYCKRHNIIFEGTLLDKKIDNNFESEARKFRYAFFEKLLKKYNSSYILTAHHGDDLIETVLMRLSRGSNLSGYAGIKVIDGKYFHPLLGITKKEIIDYLKENNIKYFNDKTNEEDDHTRNRYRHNILPFLKSENKNVHLKYLKFSNLLCKYDDFLNNYIIKKGLINNNTVYIPSLLKEDELVQRKVFELIIKDIQGTDLLDVSDVIIDNIITLINSKKSNASIDLNNNYIVKKSYDICTICKKEDIINFETEFTDFYEDEEWIIRIVSMSNEDDNSVIRLNLDEIRLPLIIRNRRIKDRMELKNLGTKRLKDIFIDSKIPKDKRNSYPILTDSLNHIIWIPNLKKSKFAKDKKEKYDIILKCERKIDNEKCSKK